VAVRGALAGLGLHGAVLADLAQVVFELVDAPHDAPPVDLELRLAGATRVHAAAALLGQLHALAADARQPVAQLRELDLRLALLARRVLGEDVEDHRGAVERAALEDALEVELLRGCELLVEHDGVGVDLLGQLVDLLGLALADERAGVGRAAPLHDTGHDVRAGGVDQLLELVERRVGVLLGRGRDGDADEHDALAEVALDEAARLAAEVAEAAAVRVARGAVVAGRLASVAFSHAPSLPWVARCRRCGRTVRRG